MKRLSIVHTESALDWAEPQAFVLDEAQGLKARGHDVRLICPPESRSLVEARRRGVPATALPIARKRPLGVKVLYEWLKRNRCDVVVTHGSTDAWLAALALLALGRPVPMVLVLNERIELNVATRWLHKRAAARVVMADKLEAMERIYAEVRR